MTSGLPYEHYRGLHSIQRVQNPTNLMHDSYIGHHHLFHLRHHDHFHTSGRPGRTLLRRVARAGAGRTLLRHPRPSGTSCCAAPAAGAREAAAGARARRGGASGRRRRWGEGMRQRRRPWPGRARAPSRPRLP
uniref:Uncharacterized protein n=1 Tax=Arundo donax TaxID=35708 RepID=A0A0A9EH14_ARUDO